MQKSAAIFMLGVSVLFLASFSLLQAADEQLTFTTYYPSPYGSYIDLTVSNSLMVGPVNNGATIWGGNANNVPGAVVASGSAAAFLFVDRNSGYSAGTPGNTYAWYNTGGVCRLWTTVNGDILQISSNGAINPLKLNRAAENMPY